jgi:hypothetical protein
VLDCLESGQYVGLLCLIFNFGSLQFKEVANVFGKGRTALSGKVGGLKDDVVIACQLGIYFSKEEYLYR